MTLYMLGVLDQGELEEIMNALMTDGTYDSAHMEPYDLEDFLGMEFLLLNTSDFYAKRDGMTYTADDGTVHPIWYDQRDFAFDQEGFVTANGTKLKISGIVRPREGASATSITGAIGYTKALTDEILARNTESEVLKQQKATPNYNVLTGLKFERVPYTRENIHELIEKVDDATMQQLYAYMTQTILNDPKIMEQLVVDDFPKLVGFFPLLSEEQQATVLKELIDIALSVDPTGYSLFPAFGLVSSTTNGIMVNANNVIPLLPILSDEQIQALLVGDPQNPTTTPGLLMIAMQNKAAVEELYGEMTTMVQGLSMDERLFNIVLTQKQVVNGQEVSMISDEQFADLEETLYSLAPQTDATYDSVLRELGDAEAVSPASINFYAIDFESKDTIESFIADYNSTVEEADQLKYTDMVGIMMSSVTTIINAITYVLIAFVAISLVVSSIMIGIITYISVLERTKEIGILRAIGASKKDISRVFNAETLIVGFVAGAIGILSTLVLNLLINIILFNLTGIVNLKASLPVGGAIILIVISMALTLIAGLFPSGIAAKKNPVEALRSE